MAAQELARQSQPLRTTCTNSGKSRFLLVAMLLLLQISIRHIYSIFQKRLAQVCVQLPLNSERRAHACSNLNTSLPD